MVISEEFKMRLIWVFVLSSFGLLMLNLLIPYDYPLNESFSLYSSCILCSLTAIVILISNNRKSIYLNYADMSLFAFVLFVLLQGVMYSPNQLCTPLTLTLISAFSGYIMFRQCLFTIEYFVYGLLIISLLILVYLNVYCALQYFNIIEFHSAFMLTGPFSNSGILCHVLAVFSVLAYAILKAKTNLISIGFRILTFSIILTSCAVLCICLSRTGILMMCVGVFTSHIYDVRLSGFSNKLKRMIGAVALVLVVGGCFCLYLLKKDSADGRVFIWNNMIAMIWENPVSGVGYSLFPATYNLKQLDFFKENAYDFTLHKIADATFYGFNDYLQILVETGIIGFLLFMFFLISVLFLLIRQTKDHLKRILLPVIVAFLIGASFYYIFYYPIFLYLFLIACGLSSNESLSNVRVNFSNSLFIRGGGILFLVFFSLLAGKMVYKSTEWSAIHAGSENLMQKKAIYTELQPELNSNYYFLNTYLEILQITDSYEECLKLVEITKSVYISPDLLAIEGWCLQKLGRINEAEQVYENSVLMVPHKFIPRETLLLFYHKYGQVDQAVLEAKKIIALPVKVPSQKVEEIKNYARVYLIENDHFN